MGEFNMNSLITHLVSGIVLVNLSTVIVSVIITYLTGEYGKNYSKIIYTKKSIDVPCFGKDESESETEDEEVGREVAETERKSIHTLTEI